jgi:LysR family glycine cleavage system transcriptional activator
MPRRLPPLNALRAFETAARLGSFTAAANELHVTHGAISRQVRAFEDWMDLALFERSNRKVTLTGQGRTYFAEIGTAFDRTAAAPERQYQRGPARLLRVHALDTFSMRWLIPRLARFASQYPSIELKLTTSPEPIPALREPFDVIIRGGPDDVDDYVSRPFLTEGRIPVCSPALEQIVADRLRSAT